MSHASMRKWRAENPERNRMAIARATRVERQRHPLRVNAQRAVYRALKRGDLIRETCLFCDSEKVEAHHHDYTKPLLVTWLCMRHHRLAHKSEQIRRGKVGVAL